LLSSIEIESLLQRQTRYMKTMSVPTALTMEGMILYRLRNIETLDRRSKKFGEESAPMTTNQNIESTTNKHSAEMVRQIYLEKRTIDSDCVEIQRKVLESDLEGIVRAYPRSEWFRKGDSSFI